MWAAMSAPTAVAPPAAEARVVRLGARARPAAIRRTKVA
jgi:hypothetical protein